MNVVVTGGAGFIGSYVLQELLTSIDFSKRKILVVDDLTSGEEHNIPADDTLAFLESDIRDGTEWRQHVAEYFAPEAPDRIIHLAARTSLPESLADPDTFISVNIRGTLEVVLAAQAWDAHVTFASSAAVYGDADTAVRETDLLRPSSVYGMTKLAGEGLLTAYGVRSAAFRFFNAYGPRQPAYHPYASVIPKFHDALLRGVAPTIHGDGGQTRDFIYASDLARVIVTASAAETRHDPVNVGSGVGMSVGELLGVMKSITRVNGSAEADIPVNWSKEDPGSRRSVADLATFQKHYADWTPVPLSDGLRSTWRWHRQTMGGRIA